MMTTKMDIIEFKPKESKALSNLGGIEIMVNESGDAVTYSYYGKPTGRWQEIKFNQEGRAYFTVGNSRQYLDEFIKYNR